MKLRYKDYRDSNHKLYSLYQILYSKTKHYNMRLIKYSLINLHLLINNKQTKTTRINQIPNKN